MSKHLNSGLDAMDQLIVASLLTRAAHIILALEQKEFPFLKDIPIDLERQKFLYEALEDPGLDPGVREELTDLRSKQLKQLADLLDYCYTSKRLVNPLTDDMLEKAIPERHEDIGYMTPRLAGKISNAIRFQDMQDDHIMELVKDAIEPEFTDRNRSPMRSYAAVIWAPKQRLSVTNQMGINVLTKTRELDMFQSLCKGLDANDIREAASLCKNPIEWTPKFTGSTIKSSEQDVQATYEDYGWYLFFDDNAVIDSINNWVEEVEREQEEEPSGQSGPLDKPKLKKLPEDLSGDQLAMLRMMEKLGAESLSTKDLRAAKLDQTPLAQQLIKESGGKPIRKEDILKSRSGSTTLEMGTLKSNWEFHNQKWAGVQTIFSETNHVFLVTVSPDTARKAFGGDVISSPDMKAYIRNTVHPHVREQLTVGWVRYTLFGTDIWIDEVQTDLFKKLPEDLTSSIKTLEEDLLAAFVREMRSRGFERIFMSTLDFRKEAYHGAGMKGPPAHIYRDLPQKLRFRKESGGSAPEAIRKAMSQEDEHALQKYGVWVLAKNLNRGLA